MPPKVFTFELNPVRLSQTTIGVFSCSAETYPAVENIYWMMNGAPVPDTYQPTMSFSCPQVSATKQNEMVLGFLRFFFQRNYAVSFICM